MPVSAFDRSQTALLGLVIGAVMISFSGVWVKLSHVAPSVSAFYRVFFGGLLLLPAALYRRELRWSGARHMLLLLTCGGLFALDLTLYHYSIQYIGPGLGTILPNFEVFILAAVGIFCFREKVGLLFVCAVPLALAGLFLLVGVDWHRLGPLYRLGVYCGLGAAVCYAAFLLLMRRLQAHQAETSVFYLLTMVSLVTAALLAADILRVGGSFALPDRQSLFALVGLGLFSQAVGWILITNALPQVRASLSGLILLAQPALAFVWDVLLFQRPTSRLNWVGVAIALLAIYLGSTKAPGPGSRKPLALHPSD